MVKERPAMRIFRFWIQKSIFQPSNFMFYDYFFVEFSKDISWGVSMDGKGATCHADFSILDPENYFPTFEFHVLRLLFCRVFQTYFMRIYHPYLLLMKYLWKTRQKSSRKTWNSKVGKYFSGSKIEKSAWQVAPLPFILTPHEICLENSTKK